MNSDLRVRRDRYCDIGNRLAHVESSRIDALLGASDGQSGWGGSHVISVGPSKVFVKRIPVTDVEHENIFSTENLHHLPTWYNYGVGSAGFGAFRELVAHIKTTNWVLDGAIENFPLMYHYRIHPCSGSRPELDEERHKGYVDYWGADENIDRYIRNRHTARHEIVLFLEHIPGVLDSWLLKHQDRWEHVIAEMGATIAFLL